MVEMCIESRTALSRLLVFSLSSLRGVLGVAKVVDGEIWFDGELWLGPVIGP